MWYSSIGQISRQGTNLKRQEWEAEGRRPGWFLLYCTLTQLLYTPSSPRWFPPFQHRPFSWVQALGSIAAWTPLSRLSQETSNGILWKMAESFPALIPPCQFLFTFIFAHEVPKRQRCLTAFSKWKDVFLLIKNDAFFLVKVMVKQLKCYDVFYHPEKYF